MGTLDGKVAFITGAGSGIGRGTAERLASEGCDICIVDMDEQAAEETADIVGQHGRSALVRKGNVAVPQHLEQAAAACVDKFGRLDIAVANAGIGRGGSVLDMPLKDWQDQLDINLTGVFLTVQATAREMVRLGNGGRIVCISSLAALNTGPGMWSYSATKAGVKMMVRGWAQELGEHGINVNAIGPGIIDTPLAAGLAGTPGGALRDRVESGTPAGRVGQPADIAGLVNYMAGPDGAFMSGSYVLIDGGLRDARTGGGDDDTVTAERMQLFAASQARTARLQPMIDDRD